ncbi:MAG: DNA polymerase III subunit beta [Clostridia bacterium]
MALKFKTDKEILLKAIQPAMYAASNKTTLPALEGLLFSICENELTVCGYDQERGIKTTNVVFGIEDGSLVLNAKKIWGIILNFPDGEIKIECDQNNIARITGGMSDFSIHGLSSDLFPSLPELTGENSFNISSKLLKDIIQTTSYAVAQTDARPILLGEFFKIENTKITVVAADNFRLAMREEFLGVGSNNSKFSFVVPGKTLSDFAKIIDENEEVINVEFTKKYIIFSYKEIIVFSRLFEGEYLDYSKVIPTDPKTFITINKEAFIECLERTMLINDEKQKTPICCKFCDNTLNVSCFSQYGTVNDIIPITLVGKEIEIGFNIKYLIETLRACKEDELSITLFSPFMAMIINPINDDEKSKSMYLVLPRRL